MKFTDQEKVLSEASRIAYSENIHKSDFKIWNPKNIDTFKGGSFTVFTASDDDNVVVSFRGTQVKINSFDDLVTSVLNWIANFDYEQVYYEDLDFSVHKGFDGELDSIYENLPEVILDHGAQEKQCFVTGHSAGGALATLAARRLIEIDGIPVDVAHVFSSPRVGDRNFSKSYPLPLYRFERRDDLIPHLPFSPTIANILGKLLLNRILELFPNLSAYRTDKVEYVHAGRLFFIDWGNELLHSEDLFGYLIQLAIMRLFEKRTFPGTPMPKQFMDVTRIVTTMENIVSQVNHGKNEYVKDHDVTIMQGVLKKLL